MSKTIAMPAELAEIIATHRALFGGFAMEADGGETPPERPDGIEATEWDALGDPGKQALVRERQRATDAERKLAAALAPKPKPPAPAPAPKASEPPAPKANGEPGDMAALIQAAVEAAVAPLRQAQEQQAIDAQARAVIDAVKAAAADRLHDASDATSLLDLTALVGADGAPDTAKVTAAINDLVAAKPHLARSQPYGRQGNPALYGAPAGPSAEDKVKASLARMQAASGIKLSTN